MNFDITYDETEIINPDGKPVATVLVLSHGLEIARFMGPGACGQWLLQVPDLNGEYTRPACGMFPTLELGKEYLMRQVGEYENPDYNPCPSEDEQYA